MSNRERWVIYPLLFFAFLMGARDNYVKPELFDCTTITCRQLSVQGMDGRTLVSVGSSEDEAGALAIYGARQPVRIPGDEVATARLRKPGHQIIKLGADDYGGYLRVFGARPGIDLQLGHDGLHRFSGLTAIDQQGGYLGEPETPATKAFWGPVFPWQPSAADGEVPSEHGESGEIKSHDSTSADALEAGSEASSVE